jgi:hypothetical protein
MAAATRSDDCSGVASRTTIPPNPSIESFSPVFPKDRFSILFLLVSRKIPSSPAGKHEIRGVLAAVVLINARLFIGNFSLVPEYKLASIQTTNNQRNTADWKK